MGEAADDLYDSEMLWQDWQELRSWHDRCLCDEACPFCHDVEEAT